MTSQEVQNTGHFSVFRTPESITKAASFSYFGTRNMQPLLE